MVCGCSRVKLEDGWETYVNPTHNHSDNGVVIVFCVNNSCTQIVFGTFLTKINYGIAFPTTQFSGHRQIQACSKLIQKLPHTGMKVIEADMRLDIQPSALNLTRAFFSPAPA